MKVKLGDYTIGKTIGQGAFSKVKLATHNDTGQKVAIKVIDKKLMEESAKKSKKIHEEREKRRLLALRQKAQIEAVKELDRNRKLHGKEELDKEEPVDFSTLIQQVAKETRERMTLPETVTVSVDQPTVSKIPFVSAFQKEVLLLMRLNHPNIIKTFQVIETDEECYVVMEYAKGGELMDFITVNGKLSEKDARKIFRQIVAGMDYIHRSNVVHRDLKLENLLLSQDKDILISDFGLGRTFDGETGQYMKTFCGTPNYAAVELISGVPYNGIKSDIWAMGVVLYIMIVGEPPFAGKSISDLYKKIKSIDYVIPNTFSEELIDLFSKIFVKDPMKRVDMDSIISHPWINFGNLPPLIRKAPAIAKIGDDVLLSHVIKSISHENGMVVYHFNPLQSKRNSLPVGSLDDNKRNGLSGRSALQSPTERKSIVISSQANDLQNIIPPKSNRRFSFQEIPDRNGEVNQTPRKSGIFGISEENAHSGPKFQSTDSSISAVTNKLSGPSSRRPSITVRSENDFGVVEMKQILPEDSDIPEDPSIPEVSDIPEGSVIPEPSKKVAQTDSNTNIILPKSQSLPVKKMRSYSHSSKGKIFKSEELKSSDVPIPKRGRRATLTFLETNSSKIVPVAAVPMDRENAVLRRMSMVGPSKKEASSENNTGSLNNSNTIEDSLSALDKTINIEDIMSFHTIHKPPKTIRTMRFSFNRAGSSNRDPATMFQDLHQSLIKYSRIDGINLKYQRHEDYYLFTCKQLDSNGNIIVSFEAEICKVWLLNLHALRTRRMTGEFCHFKEAYHQILSELGWG